MLRIMVRYGESLEKARRPGWDAAYLDYASLKSLLEEVERLHAAATSAGDDINGSSSSSYSKGDFLAAASGEANDEFEVSDVISSTKGLSHRSPKNMVDAKDSEMVALLGTTSLSPSQQMGLSSTSMHRASTSNDDQEANLSLKTIAEDVPDKNLVSSTLLNSQRKLIQFKAYEASELFLGTLRKEVEKVSLFALSRQGELADAVGSLRFNPHLDGGRDDPLKFPNLIIRHDSKCNVGGGGEYGSFHSDATPQHSMTSSESEDDPMADELWFLLPSVTPGSRKIMGGPGDNTTLTSNSSLLFRESLETTAPRPLFRGDAILRTKNNRNEQDKVGQSLGNSSSNLETENEISDESGTKTLDPYTFIGVELLHLLRFICVNAMVRHRY